MPDELDVVVLIVDDAEQMRGSLEAFLQTVLPEASILGADGPERAFRLIEEHQVDVVLTDHRMPGMTGYEFLQRVREHAPEAGRLLMTGKPQVDLAQRALNEGGVHRFFTKPLDPDEILEAIRELTTERG